MHFCGFTLFEAADNVLALLADSVWKARQLCNFHRAAICQITQHHLHKYKGILVVTMKSCVSWVCNGQAATDASW